VGKNKTPSGGPGIRGSGPCPGARAILRLAFGLLLVAGCTETYILDLGDIDLETPEDLPQRLMSYRAGEEKWHGDPKAVADLCLRHRVKNLPWIAEPYKPSVYKVQESADWGTFVTRGYIYPSGYLMRYRVKIRAYREIWYPIQVSHYKIHDLSDDDQWHPHEH
jgi:hypothetical protein